MQLYGSVYSVKIWTDWSLMVDASSSSGAIKILSSESKLCFSVSLLATASPHNVLSSRLLIKKLLKQDIFNVMNLCL